MTWKNPSRAIISGRAKPFEYQNEAERGDRMDRLAIRPATPDDRSHLRSAIVELHEYERSLHSSRLPGEETADAYLDWMLAEVERNGAVLIAEAWGRVCRFRRRLDR